MTDIDIDRLREAAAYADQWLAFQQQHREIPGLVVAIRFRGHTLLCNGHGFANREQQVAMTPQHVFRIASHSKTFTAAAIMQLKEQGKLRLDDPLGEHIAWLRSNDHVGRTTIRQTLNHAAGIIRDGNDADYWQLYRDFPDAAQLRQLVEEGGEVLPPNETFKYSNIGYSLLGMVIEAVAGMPYNEYVQRHIVDRLGLADTGPETNDRVRERMATGYTTRQLDLPRLPLPDISTGAMSPATGFYSTAEDLCRYASAHFLGNEELLTDDSKREMQQPYWEVEQADEHYGLGLSVKTIGERRMVGHGGGFPGHSTKTVFDPTAHLVVVVLTNESSGSASTLAESIVKIINFALDKGKPREEEAQRLHRFVGRFANEGGVTDVVRFGDELFALSPAADDPVKNVTALTVEDCGTLRITRTGGYDSPGQTMRYVRDESGQVVMVVDAGMSSYPPDIFRARFLHQFEPPSRTQSDSQQH